MKKNIQEYDYELKGKQRIIEENKIIKMNLLKKKMKLRNYLFHLL